MLLQVLFRSYDTFNNDIISVVFPGRAWYVFSFLRRQNKLRFSVIRFPTGHAVSKENARSEETQYCHWLYNGFVEAWDRPVLTH